MTRAMLHFSVAWGHHAPRCARPLFERHATTVMAAADALRQMLEGGERAAEHCRAVMRYEEEADAITRDVLIGIRSTFITPFDRGDIKDLISSMD